MDHGRELTRHVLPRNISHLGPRVAVEAVIERIVDHGADRSAEMRLGLGDHGVHRRPVRHVSLNGDHALAQLSRQALRLLAAGPPVDHDPRALPRKGPRRRRADAARAAGDENDLIADFHGLPHAEERSRAIGRTLGEGQPLTSPNTGCI
ncbi:hypothetical protein D3C80_1624260 [compost metagenome]